MSKLLQTPDDRPQGPVHPLDVIGRELVFDLGGTLEQNTHRARQLLDRIRRDCGPEASANAEALIISGMAKELYGWADPPADLCPCGEIWRGQQPEVSFDELIDALAVLDGECALMGGHHDGR